MRARPLILCNGHPIASIPKPHITMPSALITSGDGRFTALDILRGLTLAGMLVVNNPGSWSQVYAPLLHADFNGLTPTDFVFPFFMFIMGSSIFLSLRKYSVEQRPEALRRVCTRTLKIFIVGLAINALSMMVFRGFQPATLRILGVLQRLALCYGAVGLMALYMKSTWKLLSAALLLLAGYAWLLAVAGGYVLDETNIVAVVDRAVLGADHMYHGEGFAFDPEGLVSTLPCIAHVTIGYLAAKTVFERKEPPRPLQLLVMGAVMVMTGIALDCCGIPFNKKIWSPSFVFVTCGSCALLLSASDVLISSHTAQRLMHPFKVLGMNCIAVFVVSDLLAIFLAKVGWGGQVFECFATFMPEKAASLLFALLFLCVNLAIAWCMYCKRIFIKL